MTTATARTWILIDAAASTALMWHAGWRWGYLVLYSVMLWAILVPTVMCLDALIHGEWSR